jgi:hypothetical protein
VVKSILLCQIWFTMSDPTAAIPKRFRLRTVGGVLTELARLYRMAHHRQLPWSDAAAGARILREIRTTIEGDEIERRLAAVEQQLGAVAKPNGHDRQSEARP